MMMVQRIAHRSVHREQPTLFLTAVSTLTLASAIPAGSRPWLRISELLAFGLTEVPSWLVDSRRDLCSHGRVNGYFSNARNTPAATAEPITPATFGPIAAMIGLTRPSVCLETKS